MYDTKKKGYLSKVTDVNGYEKELFYDDLCRVTTSKERTATGEDWDETKIEYNISNQIDKKWLSNEAFMKYKYDKETGIVDKITFNDVAGNFNKVIFDSPTYNSMGKLTQYTLDIDNNIAVVNAYDATTENYTGSSVYLGGVSEPNKLFAFGITYHDDNNIHSRNVYMNGLDLQSQTIAMNTTEYFTYDKLNRLTYWGSTDVPYTDPNYATSKKIDYDVLGQKSYNENINISSATDNDYSGEAADAPSKSIYHPDVVKTEQNNLFPSQTITYNFYNKVSTITNTVGTTIKELSISYRPNRSRYKTVFSENNIDLLTKYFYKGYEKAIDHSANTERKIYYLDNGDGLAAVYIKETGQSPAFYYVMKDHLSSIWALLDENGDFAERYAYDPWGNRKNPDDWSIADSRTDFIIDRGYTSHVPYCSKSTSKAQYFWQTVAIPYKPECSGGFIGKHNDLLGMINANGRYYDPILGEFISPDPYVQMPGNAQNFNRYAYCLNNPVSYSDPTGEFFWVIPSIGWSMEGGLTVGVSVALGIPGGLSAQGGISYSYKNSSNNGFAAYVGGSFLFNTAYVAYSENSGFSVGYTAGLSPQTGLPISTNALTVGVNYNITNNEWSGNISALYLSESGRPTFNLSVSAMVYPEHTTNWVKGKGFTNNRQVFQNFKDGVYNIPDQSSWEQEAINYFCGQGTYREDVPKGHTGLVDEPVTYYGATNIDNGNIYFGELALTSYDNLIQTFYKERYTSNKIRKGKGVMTAEIDIKEFEYYPEEALGFQHSYRYSGLYRGASVDSYGLANSYWLQVYGTHLINHKNLFYNIRRLW